ncbi:MAG: hypothetical protein QOG64_1623 [Acidimicrobiaceae bacterium]|nr:hypothetical protein [Acidimicrobiaceae bacterium]
MTEVSALLARVEAIYWASGVPPRRGGPARCPLPADARHRLALATLADQRRRSDRSFLAAIVACRADSAEGLRSLLRLFGANAVATVLHWVVAATGPTGEERWSAADVMAAARGEATAAGPVPSGALVGLAALQPSLFRLAPVASPPSWSGPPPRGRSAAAIGVLLRSVESIYFGPYLSADGRRWEADELHALTLAAIALGDGDESAPADDDLAGSFLATLVDCGLDTVDGLTSLLRLQAAGAARTALCWLLPGRGHGGWDDETVLADAEASSWWTSGASAVRGVGDG